MDDLKLWSENEVLEFVLTWAAGKQKPLCQKSSEQVSGTGEEFRDDNTSPSKCSTASCALDLADILQCTRYLLITPSFLHGTLAMHPQVKADHRCQALVEKISWYHSQPSLQQTWCPPAAIHRESSHLTNVVLMCQISASDHLFILDLKTMVWKTISIARLKGCEANAQLHVLCFNSEIYVVTEDKIYRYLASLKRWQSILCSTITGVVRVFNDSLYEYTFSEDDEMSTQSVLERYNVLNFSTIPTEHGFISEARSGYKTLRGYKQEKVGSLEVKDATHIGSTEIIFCGKENLNSYTIFSINESCDTSETYPDQLGSSSPLVTFKFDQEVFVLQENGCLWRIRIGDGYPLLIIEHELVLWDGEIPLRGAVLYNDLLIIVGDFPDQEENCGTLERRLPGVFQGVRKIKVGPSAATRGRPGITLATLPKFIFGATTVYN
ncbi:kelch-like protein 20 [Elysia marginata]|uniref:Kelch-like protein 20 n=1 Tax=Elysia marginata TaxID=1093978 RepID=A0AAV4HPA0_9GAST|nr:kelch-like protein 20 [Elysia marginata]